MKKMIFGLVVTTVVLFLIIATVKTLGFENGMIAVLALIIGENRTTHYWKEK